MASPADITRDFWLAQDTAVSSSFKLGAIAQASIGLAALSAAYLHYLRTGNEQDVSVDARHAALEFHSHAYYSLEGQSPPDLWDPIAGLYATKDQTFIRIHTNFPHHRRGVLDILEIPDTPETTKNQVADAILRWNAEEFEQEAINRGLCVSAYRSFDEWDKHPHAATLIGKLPLTITKINATPKRSISPGRHPLQGFRVLDLSRVLAGPVAGRTLAAHGADDLLITSPKLPALPGTDTDTSRGKRTTQLDLTDPTDLKKLRDLVSEADVFLQAYRPGTLSSKGLGTQDLVQLRSGIVSANLCAWGWEGPWKDRRGFDSLVQTATGFNYAEAEAYHQFLHPGTPLPTPLTPKPFPFQVLDYTAGYFLTYGIIVALCKTITEGGSYEVRVSLAEVAQYLRSLGRIPPETAFGRGNPLPPTGAPLSPEVQRFSSEWKMIDRRVQLKK
ncbi:hypothetical protein Agabi119p4_7185 [Agaricus bisporus var. burnettii]|uniref:CoA-transferase family III n=1 Tax=Agaricus bisporus var. burnettii TaxID=192524 RepID=A0A8H7C750_AGABI|nr:hypothetical protein Agabi119p4_7185 [Agaricus bisporus var. burnettii]